jgi:protein-disulfide isomerase
MKTKLIAASLLAIMSPLSAESSPLDQAIIKKEINPAKQANVMPKVHKSGAKKAVKNTGPSKEEQKILETIAKYPEIVAQILHEGVQNKQAEQKIGWAKNIRDNLPAIMEDSIQFGGAEDADVSVLMIIDFLCPHCQTHLKMVSDLRKKNANIKFIVYSVPLFQGDLTREYGLILNAAYRKDAIKFLDLLGAYANNKPSKEALIKKVEDFKIGIQGSDYNDLSAYDKHSDLMDKIGLTQVPASFVLLKDKKGGTIVVPLNIMDADSLVKTIEAIESTSSEERAKIKASLGQ